MLKENSNISDASSHSRGTVRQTFIFARLGKVTSCDRLIYSFNAVINLPKMDAQSTWEVARKKNVMRLLFCCRKVISFFNLGTENPKGLRRGSSPNRTDCVQIKWFGIFAFTHPWRPSCAVSIFTVTWLEMVYSAGKGSLCHASCAIMSAWVVQGETPESLLSFGLRAIAKAISDDKPNAKCDNQTNSKDGVKPRWHEMAFDAALLRATISRLSNAFRPEHLRFLWSVTRVAGNEYEMTFLCACECVHMFEDETRCLPNPKFLCDWCCKCLHLG